MVLVLDTYAWIEYFLATEKGKKVRTLLDEHKIITPILVIVEFKCKALREKWEFAEFIEFIKSKSQISYLSDEISDLSSDLYIEMRKKSKDSSIIDAIILATARVNDAKLLTGDKHFKTIEDVLFLE